MNSNEFSWFFRHIQTHLESWGDKISWFFVESQTQCFVHYLFSFFFFLLHGLKISEKECIKVEPSTRVVAIRIWVESSHIMKLLESLLLSGRYENEFSWNYRKSVVPEINQYISIHCKWGQTWNLPIFSQKSMKEMIR